MPARKSSVKKEETEKEEAKTTSQEEEDYSEENEDDDRSSFNYSGMKFIQHKWKSSKINHSQFGHKKYRYYTEHSYKKQPVKTVVKDIRKSLQIQPDVKAKEGRKCPNFFRVVSSIIGVICFVGALIQRFHTPQSNLQQIISANDIVVQNIKDLSDLLKNSQHTTSLLFSAFVRVGQLLNDTSYSDLAKEEIRNQRIVPLVYQMIKIDSNECESPAMNNLIRFSFYFLHDLAAAGGESAINRDAIIRVVSRCNEFGELMTALFSHLVTVSETNDGLKSLNGIAKPIVKEMTKIDFGTQGTPIIKFFARWASLTKLGQEDEDSVCAFLDYAAPYHKDWVKNFNAMVCMLSMYVKKCPAYEKIDAENLFRRDECVDIFNMFKTEQQEQEQEQEQQQGNEYEHGHEMHGKQEQSPQYDQQL